MHRIDSTVGKTFTVHEISLLDPNLKNFKMQKTFQTIQLKMNYTITLTFKAKILANQKITILTISKEEGKFDRKIKVCDLNQKLFTFVTDRSSISVQFQKLTLTYSSLIQTFQMFSHKQ